VETETISESAQGSEPIKPRNFFSRLGGVYFAPRETFTEIGRSPGVLWPIIALVIIGLLVGFYLAHKLDIESLVAKQLDQVVAAGRMTKEQAEQQMGIATKVGRYQVIIVPAIEGLLFALVIAAVFKLITFFVGAENRFKQVFGVTLYTILAISIVQYILFVAILYFKNPAELDASSLRTLLASNLGALLEGVLGEDSLPKFLAKFFGWVDIFAIWMIALLSIGYSAVSRKLKTSTAATWIGGLYLIIAIIAAAIGSRS
jgi:hypothetical protein